MNDVSKTIGWAEKTWNPVVGCKNDCWYCYGKRLRKRFNPDIPYNQITNYDERLEEPLKLKKPSKIFVGSMTDLFADWMPEYNIKNILEIVKQCPQHTFQFLSKNLEAYKDIRFPDNCWVGITITNRPHWHKLYYLTSIGARVRFISFEPLLEDVCIIDTCGIDWIIIGAMTGQGSQRYQPKPEWIENILQQADQYKISVFMKNNLSKHWKGKLRQEWPKTK